MNRQKQLSINLIASITAFIINMGIYFFLTPYITEKIGVEAYGFVSLGANFINYASLVTIALNSMAGRFITIEIHQDNWEGANKYFNSVLLSNAIVAGFMLIPSILCVVYIDKIVNVPPEILTDVKVLFAFLFANYLVSIMVSSFGVSTFATNKLYLNSLRQIESGIIKAVLLVLLFVLFKPAVSYLGFAAFVILLYTAVFNIYYTKKFLPNITIKKAYFNIKAVLELISSGIWNTVIQVGVILLSGLDLLIANLFISATAMGTIAVAKTVPLLITTLTGVIASVFMPDFTILYAQEKRDELVMSIKRSMKILGLIVNIPIAILVAFGNEFFTLWIPTEDPNMLQTISIICLATLVVSGSINSIYGVFTVTNNLRANALVLIFTGIFNVALVFVLLNVTSLGIYAIILVSSVSGVLRNLLFTVPFGAKYLNIKWNTFYPEVFKSVTGFFIVTLIGLSINYFININNWVLLIIFAGLTGILGLVVNSIFILNKSERIYLQKKIKQRRN